MVESINIQEGRDFGFGGVDFVVKVIFVYKNIFYFCIIEDVFIFCRVDCWVDWYVDGFNLLYVQVQYCLFWLVLIDCYGNFIVWFYFKFE